MTYNIPLKPWDITETVLKRENNYRNETIFSLGNGYLGSRGTFEENYDFGKGNGMEGNFINGFYESETIRYGEFNFGFPEKSQSMLNVTNAKIIRLFVDGEEFHMYDGTIREYKRNLSLKDGILQRTCIWETKSGKQLRVTIQRMASFSHKNLLSIRYQVESLNFTGAVQIVSQIETEVINHTNENNPLIDYGPYGISLLPEKVQTSDRTIEVISRVKNNGFSLYTGCRHLFETEHGVRTVKEDTKGHLPSLTFEADVKEGCTFSMTKHIIYMTHETDAEVCEVAGRKDLEGCGTISFADLKREQRAFLDSFWEKVDVSIEGDDAVQQGLRFNLFHILQSTGRDGITSIGAKGLSGEGYEGHVFWDTEMYMIPLYTHTYPEMARNLLLYRYHTLEAAREHAKELGHKSGALYPWRTINGKEASAYYPLGSAQYHINSDIAYAINQYVQISGDMEFMYQYGLEMLCEISRVFADVGHFSEWKNGQYVINCVTGPDEYNAIVDNNFYTNLGARETLRATMRWLEMIKKEDISRFRVFTERLMLSEKECEYWQKIIENMYLGYDEKLGIYVQDDTFLQKKPWDAETDKEKKQSLLYVNYHPLYVFRHQMCKQADTPLAMLLFNHLFTAEEMKQNYEFYYPRTVHHSSLSQCIYAIIESRLGRHDAAYRNFVTSARMDLDDCHNNVYAGIHGANMAGTWMTLTYGLAGMNTTDGTLHFDPYLPERWKSYSFKIVYHGCALKILIEKNKVTYSLQQGEKLTFSHRGNTFELKNQEMIIFEENLDSVEAEKCGQ